MQKIFVVFSFLILWYTSAYGQIGGTLWDVQGIYKTPPYTVLSNDSILGIVYEGLEYKNHPKRIFAYYATPGTITGNRSKDKKLPAVVLVHGGGGAAFREWVMIWAKRGYAAFAMDWRGNGADGKHLTGGFEEVNGQTPFFTLYPALNEQWMYQAVADVILAHNLIRSFPEVDTSRTAVAGISWGGVLTCTVSGLDHRFKVAVPIYGCGYFPTSMYLAQGLNELNAKERSTWLRQYDPSHYVGKATMPLLFVNGATDAAFYLDSYARTYKLVRNKTLSIQYGLLHGHYGHGSGWEIREPYFFVDSYINGGKRLNLVGTPNITAKKQITAKVHISVPVSKAFLNYTTDTINILMNRKWTSVEVLFEKNTIVSFLPPVGTTMWFVSVIDNRGLKTSGEVQFAEEKLKKIVQAK